MHAKLFSLFNIQENVKAIMVRQDMVFVNGNVLPLGLSRLHEKKFLNACIVENVKCTNFYQRRWHQANGLSTR